MELVVLGLMGGFVLGMVVGWIGGRMTGIGEGRFRERCFRDDQAQLSELAALVARHPGVAPEVLAQDSMAEFAAGSDRGPGKGGAA